MATGRSKALRRAGSFLSLLALEVGAVVLLTRLGSVPELRIPWHNLTTWLVNSPVEDVLAAILRNIALLIAWWLLGSNLLYMLASLTRVPGAIRAVRWLTLPVVRRATDHALALTLATSLVGGGTGTAIAGTAPVAMMAPQVPGPVAAEHPSAGSAGPLAYAPDPAGPPREQAPTQAATPPGHAPRAAGLLAQQPTTTTPPSTRPPTTTTPPSTTPPSTTGYVPRPAGNAPAEQPQPTSTSASSTTGPSQSSTTAAPSTRPPTTTTPPSTTGYVPRPAGPPSTSAPPQATTPPTSTAPPGSTAPGTRPPTTTTPPTTAPPTTAPPTTAPPGGQPAPGPQPPPGRPTRSHRVVEGDNLWTISRDHLAAASNRQSSELSDHEIATYWLRVIAVNRSSLRSGNPDLIFPGELIMLPPTSGGA